MASFGFEWSDVRRLVAEHGSSLKEIRKVLANNNLYVPGKNNTKEYKRQIIVEGKITTVNYTKLWVLCHFALTQTKFDWTEFAYSLYNLDKKEEEFAVDLGGHLRTIYEGQLRKLNLEQLFTKNVPKEEAPPERSFQTIEDYVAGASQSTLQDFEILKQLGSGAFGEVKLARALNTNDKVAIKRVSDEFVEEIGPEHQLRREIDIHSRLQHPHIVKLYHWFQDEDSFNLVLEFCVRGDVFSELRKEGRFSQKKAANYLVQVCSALIYCKQSNVIHRDLKPGNLLLDVNGEVKLSDFGWAVDCSNSRRNTFCGTLDYLSPEMVERKEYGTEVDTWSVGVLLYEFLYGEPPFATIDVVWTYQRIKHVGLNFPTRTDVDAEAQDLIRKLLKKNPEERIELAAVYDHAWIQKHADPERITNLKEVNGLV